VNRFTQNFNSYFSSIYASFFYIIKQKYIYIYEDSTLYKYIDFRNLHINDIENKFTIKKHFKINIISQIIIIKNLYVHISTLIFYVKLLFYYNSVIFRIRTKMTTENIVNLEVDPEVFTITLFYFITNIVM